jgi:hypothetical protein
MNDSKFPRVDEMLDAAAARQGKTDDPIDILKGILGIGGPEATPEMKASTLFAVQLILISTMGKEAFYKTEAGEKARKAFTLMVMTCCPEMVTEHLETYRRMQKTIMEDMMELRNKRAGE